MAQGSEHGRADDARTAPGARPPGRDVSVVIPAHQDGPGYRRCLAAVGRLCPPPLEVLVVVDGDDPRVTVPDGMRRMALAEQRGPAAARNAGARVARGATLLFLDSDVQAPPTLVADIDDYLTARPEVAGLIGSYDDDPAEPNFLSQYKNLVHHHVHQRARCEGWTFWGACGAIRRDVFLALEGFRETYAVPCIEDVELGYRLRAAGATVHVRPDIQVKHLKHWTAGSLLWTDVMRRALPWSALIVQTGTLQNDLNTTHRGRAQVALALGALTVATAGLAVRPRWAAPAALPLVAATVALDRPLLADLARLRGPRFAAAAVPWQLAYHSYSGLALLLAAGREALFASGVLPRRSSPGSPRRPVVVPTPRRPPW